MTSARTGQHSKMASPGVGSFCRIGFIGVAIALFILFVVAALGWIRREDAFGLEQLRSQSQALMQQLVGRLSSLEQELVYRGLDPGLQQAFKTLDPQALAAQEALLQQQISEALEVRLLTSDGQEVADRGRPALGFAGLELIQQAVGEREVSSLEAHRMGPSDGHLGIVAPVLDGRSERVLGIAYVALPMDWLPSPHAAAEGVGRIRYRQPVGDDLVVVESAASGIEPSAPEDLSLEVPGTRLRIDAWLQRGSLLDGRILLPFAIIYLAEIVLVGLVFWWSARRLRRALSDDYAELMTMADNAIAGDPPDRFRCRLGETQPLYDRLLGLLRKQGVGSAAAPEMHGSAASRVSDASPRAAAAPSPRARSARPEHRSAATAHNDPVAVPAEIFRAYDVRGVVGKGLTVDVVRRIGCAIGGQAQARGNQTVFVARDTRDSSASLMRALVEGLTASGRDIRDLGIVPTPVLYFAACHQEITSGVMVTASHNPPEYNGLKTMLAGDVAAGGQVLEWYRQVGGGDCVHGKGRISQQELVPVYIEQMERDIAIARTLKVVVDCGHATACRVAPELFRALRCEVIEMACGIREGFPDGKVPDPAVPENLTALGERVVAEGADLGIAFDGDGDRLGVVDSAGRFAATDRVLMILATDVLSRHPGTDVVYDVKCSHHLATEIQQAGGRAVMAPSGHAPIKSKMRETGALLGGELSGHIMVKERWFGFDDAFYAAARLLEVLALDPRPSAEVFGGLPQAVDTPELLLPLAEGDSSRIMGEVMKLADRLKGAQVKTIDGLRVELDQGWGLVRASNTRPALTFRFEANDQQSLDAIQKVFRWLMDRAAPGLQLPF